MGQTACQNLGVITKKIIQIISACITPIKPFLLYRSTSFYNKFDKLGVAYRVLTKGDEGGAVVGVCREASAQDELLESRLSEGLSCLLG